jgi:SHS2 domain-containing protein
VGIEMYGYWYPEDGPPADLTVEGTGCNLEKAVVNVVLGMFNAISPLEGINSKTFFKVQVEGHDMKSLLFNLMDEFLYIHDTEKLVASKLILKINEKEYQASAECWGERIEPGKHLLGIGIKAVTYHQMQINLITEGWKIRIVFDT